VAGRESCMWRSSFGRHRKATSSHQLPCMTPAAKCTQSQALKHSQQEPWRAETPWCKKYHSNQRRSRWNWSQSWMWTRWSTWTQKRSASHWIGLRVSWRPSKITWVTVLQKKTERKQNKREEREGKKERRKEKKRKEKRKKGCTISEKIATKKGWNVILQSGHAVVLGDVCMKVICGCTQTHTGTHAHTSHTHAHAYAHAHAHKQALTTSTYNHARAHAHT